MKKPKNPGEATIKERTLTYLRGREGEHVTTAEVANALGITRDQATSALHNLAKRSLPEAVRRVGDAIWLYESTPGRAAVVGDTRQLHVLGKVSGAGGAMIAADDEGAMYEVRALADIE